jgi:hypothetical protein
MSFNNYFHVHDISYIILIFKKENILGTSLMIIILTIYITCFLLFRFIKIQDFNLNDY